MSEPDPVLNGIVLALTGMSIPEGSAPRMNAEVEMPLEEFERALGEAESLFAAISRSVEGSVSGRWADAYSGAMATFVSGEGGAALGRMKVAAGNLRGAAHETGYQID